MSEKRRLLNGIAACLLCNSGQGRAESTQMVESTSLNNKLLTYERLLDSLKKDKVQLCTSLALYLALILILYFENGIFIAALGALVPLSIGVNSLLLMDIKDVFVHFRLRKLGYRTLILTVITVNVFLVWLMLPNWQLFLITWLIPLVIKFGLDLFIKSKSK